jgi:hypothetical protein
VLLLYDAPNRPDRWDRAPYETPWGPVPPDLAARLFYLARADARVAFGAVEVAATLEKQRAAVVIARARDRELITSSGRVSVFDQGPTTRSDRSFLAFRVIPAAASPLAARRLVPFTGRAW